MGALELTRSTAYAPVFEDHRTRLLAVREPAPGEPPKPRLLDRVRQTVRARHDSRRTEQAYVRWLKRLIFRDVLGVDLPWLDGIVSAERPVRLRVVLTREEVRAVLRRLDGVPRLMACLLYGAGLRVLECCRLRVQDIDFAANQVVVRGGKGDKDRLTMLPAALLRKYPHAGREWVWQ